MNGTYPQGLPDNKFQFPSDTIMFGEKNPSSPQYYMDLLELSGQEGNDWTELNQRTHLEGSDYVFTDNSARLLPACTDPRAQPTICGPSRPPGRTNYASPNEQLRQVKTV